MKYALSWTHDETGKVMHESVTVEAENIIEAERILQKIIHSEKYTYWDVKFYRIKRSDQQEAPFE